MEYTKMLTSQTNENTGQKGNVSEGAVQEHGQAWGKRGEWYTNREVDVALSLRLN